MSEPSAQLRRLLASPGPIVIAGAHDGLTARLVEEAGFHGVWASGFEISASHGVPDASILTMTETLEAARRMADAVTIPVVADGDTGFGNAINAIRAVEAFERAGVAGLCIEDNVFPKRCSFYPGVKRLLTDVDEQTLKIRAAVGARATQEFVAIAAHWPFACRDRASDLNPEHRTANIERRTPNREHRTANTEPRTPNRT